jgi:hypothetical protein
MQDAKLKVKLKYSAHKNKSLSVALPGKGAKKVLDNPQEQGITIAPLNVEVWVLIRRSKKEKLLLSPTRVSQF